MITKIYSVYDSKAMMFHVPFYMATTPMAVRAFGDLVNDSQSMIGKHPEDYVLYEVGEFDDQTGRTNSYEQSVNLGIATQYMTKRAVDSSHIAMSDLQVLSNNKEK